MNMKEAKKRYERAVREHVEKFYNHRLRELDLILEECSNREIEHLHTRMNYLEGFLGQQRANKKKN